MIGKLYRFCNRNWWQTNLALLAIIAALVLRDLLR